jgi:hypothetical protein
VQIKLVKKAISDAVAVLEIPDLDCFPFVPAEPPIPSFYVGEVTLDPNQSFGPGPGGHDEADIVCRVLVSAAEDADGQGRLDDYLSRSGPYSIRAALNTARGLPGQLALGGTCDDFVITRIDGYRMIPTSNQGLAFGAQITVRVIGSPS